MNSLSSIAPTVRRTLLAQSLLLALSFGVHAHGNADLTLDHMGIQHGAKYLTSPNAPNAPNARGGGIFSAGIVGMLYSEATHCAAGTAGPISFARGGAIFASGGVLLSSSLVGHAKVVAMTDSAGGVISSPAAVVLINSVVSRSIRNSTIAGNMGPGVAGILAAGSDVKITNSSIAWNVNQLPGTGSGLFAEGADIELQSTLIAFNGDPQTATYSDVEGSGTLSGNHNLIHTGNIAAPADTIQQVDPLIVATILDSSSVIVQLKPGSAAINAGSNPLSLYFDQRGVGFPREIGAATDIGSYEFDLGDLVFANSFD